MSREWKTQDPFAPEPNRIPAKKEKSSRRKRGFSVWQWLFLHRSLWPILIPIAAFAFMWVAPAISSPAGIAIGSWKGVTDGLSDGYEAGEAAGLSAEDTTVTISNKIKQNEKLQVLLIDLKLSDLFTEGAAPIVGGPKYAALFLLRGTGVFTVDLAQSEVKPQFGSDGILIQIPSPEFTLYLDDSGIETLATYPKGWRLFDGSTAKGYTGWLNSRSQIDQRVQSELLGYDDLMASARASALKQVEQLAQSICGSRKSVTVQFFEEGDN